MLMIKLVAFNGHFRKNCFHPLFAFTSDGDCLGARLRPGNVHSADGVLDFLDPIVKRYRSRFILFRLRGDAAFAAPEVYEYCEGERVTYFVIVQRDAELPQVLLNDYLGDTPWSVYTGDASRRDPCARKVPVRRVQPIS